MTQEEYENITDKANLMSYIRLWIKNSTGVVIKEKEFTYPSIWHRCNPLKEQIQEVIDKASTQITKMLESKLAELEKEFADIVVGVKLETTNNDNDQSQVI